MDAHTDLPSDLFRFGTSLWQMANGERAALEGLLASSRPRLAIEVGTCEGGSLSRLALWCDEVHSFDLKRPSLPVAELPHVHLHTGDSHQLLPAVLAELTDAGRKVDFALVDGDHTAEGVCADVEDLLASPAVSRTTILLHDVVNPEVRRGIEAAQAPENPKVAHVDLDFVAGQLFHEESWRGQMWGGLGLIVVGDRGDLPVLEGRAHASYELIALARERLYGDGGDAETDSEELRVARERASRAEAALVAVEGSRSWRLTAPLRRAALHLRSRRSSGLSSRR